MQPMPDNVPEDTFGDAKPDSKLDALTHDWKLMRAYIECEAVSTHYSDGTMLAPQQRAYAALVLTMLKYKEPTT